MVALALADVRGGDAHIRLGVLDHAPLDEHRAVSDNGVYNDQVAIRDSNGDGVITLEEATIYAARVDEQFAKRQAEKAKLEAQAGNASPIAPTTAASGRDNPPTTPALPFQPPSAQQPLEARLPSASLPGESHQ
jgi:hypothetical protein